MWRLKGDNSCDIPVERTGWSYLSIRTSTGRRPRRVHKHKCSFITLLALGHPPRDPHSARAAVLVFRMISLYFINIQFTFCCELKRIKPGIWELRSFPAQQFSSNLCNRRRERTIPSLLYDTSVQERRHVQVGHKTLQQDAAAVWKDAALEIGG